MSLRLAGLLLLAFTPLQAATLLKYNFNAGNGWPALAGYSTAASGSVTVTPSVTNVGTADVYQSAVTSNGVLLAVDSTGATGAWTARLDSGVLNLLTANSSTNLGLLTLSFSLSASSSHPIAVRLESYTAAGARSGGLTALIYPAAPNFYQRFAIDLTSMTADGTGTFNPTDPKVRLSFEIGSATGGDGWNRNSAHQLRIDNVNYSSPKYYVKYASPGSDSNNGLTETTPFKTPGKAVGLAGPGDIIVMMGADATAQWYNGVSVAFSAPGTPEAWIVLKNYPGQTPVIINTGWNAVTVSRGSSNNIYTGADVPSYIEVRGLTVRGTSYIDANGDYALPAASTPYIGLVDARSNGNGIGAGGSNSTYKPHDVRFADNVVEYNPGAGIGGGQMDHLSVENNTVRYNAWWAVYANSGVSFGDAVDVDLSTTGYKMLIQGNKVYGNESMVPWGHTQAFSDGNGIIVDSYNNYNYSGRVLIQNNLSFNNGGGGIHAYKSAHVDMVHNTAYHNSASTRLRYSQMDDVNCTDVVSRNNIMVLAANPTGNSSYNENITSTSYLAGDYIQNNLLYAEGAYLANPTGANYTPNIQQANPLFLSASDNPATNDFHLRATSPALGNGQVLAYRAGVDLDGKTRLVDGADDRGPYQTRPTDVFAPVFTPQSANLTAAQSVSIASDTAGATIVYTTNGTVPTVDASGNAINGTVYTAAFSISAAVTVKAIAWKSGLGASYASTAIYTFNTATPAAVPTPTFLIPPGAYSGTVKVNLLTRTPGAYIRYTVDGTTPSATNGLWAFDQPVTVTTSALIQAVAFKPNSGRATSGVLSGSYVVRGSVGSLASGDVTEVFGAGKIRFSRVLAGSNLTATRIMAQVGAIGGNYACAIYADSSGLPGSFLKGSAPVAAPAAGWRSFALSSGQALTSGAYYWLAIWSDAATASIGCASTGGTWRETTAGFSSTWPTSVTTAAATNASYLPAMFATTDYAPAVNAGADRAVPLANPATLTGTATYGVATLADGTLTTAWSLVSGPGTVTFGNAAALTTSATFSAAGVYVLRLTGRDTYFTMWPTVTDDVTITVQTSVPAAAPTFSPPVGTYTTPQTITLSSATAGAVIHYTTDGAAPGASSPSTASGGTVSIAATATLRAYSSAAGYVDSAATSGVYTIQTVPTPAGQPLFGAGAPTGAATLALPSRPANLLLNPSFENGAANWAFNAARMTVDGTTVRTGALSARATTASGAGPFQYVNLPNGSSYLYSGWALKSLSGTSTWLSSTITGSAEVTQSFSGAAGVWQQASRAFSLPAGAGATSVQFGAWYQGSTGTAAYDDFELYQVMPAGTSYELGDRFTCSRYGQVTSLRVWHPVGGPSTYTLSLWDDAGTLLAAGRASSGSGAGWVEAVLPTPINIDESSIYTVSYTVPAGTSYQATPGGLTTAIVADPISTVVGDNGVYATAGGAFPTLSSGATNYWTDLRVNPTPSPAAPGGVVRARFTDGAGAAGPQQFPGSAGDGWVAGWVSSAAVTPAVRSANPLTDQTNNYLQISRTGGTASEEGVYRQWSVGARPDTGFARLTFDVRLDSSAAVFSAANDSLTIVGRSSAGVGAGNDASFFIRAFGAANGPLGAREWGVFNGTPGQTDAYDAGRFLPTGMIIQPGVTYSFTVDLYAGVAAGNANGRVFGTYDVTITDGATIAQVTGAGFRSAAYNSGPYLSFSTQQNNPTANLAFSVDSIEMTDLVPAPLAPIAAWRADHFAAADLADPALEATVWGDLADPDRDGIGNLQEYAFDTDPLNASLDGQPTAAIDPEGLLTLTFLRARGDLNYLVESSTDLDAWTILATNPGLVGDEVTVTDPIAAGATPRFLRVRIAR